MSNVITDWKALDEEVITHPFPMKLTEDKLSVEARVVIVLEVEGKRYEYNDVRKFHLTKSEAE